MSVKDKIKTPVSLKAHGHFFLRYLMSNPYAEEMKCSKCGYVIWPCFNEEDVTQAMKDISGKVEKCNNS